MLTLNMTYEIISLHHERFNKGRKESIFKNIKNYGTYKTENALFLGKDHT